MTYTFVILYIMQYNNYNKKCLLHVSGPDKDPLRIETFRRYFVKSNYGRYEFGWFCTEIIIMLHKYRMNQVSIHSVCRTEKKKRTSFLCNLYR